MQDVLLVAITFGLNDSDATSYYNRATAQLGNDTHAVEYLGGGFDTY
jgi:hypothetical protein